MWLPGNIKHKIICQDKALINLFKIINSKLLFTYLGNYDRIYQQYWIWVLLITRMQMI